MSTTLRRVASTAAIIAATATGSIAAPPPPPPEYVMEVGNLLSADADARTMSQLGDYIANDVHAYVNAKLVANGKADWLRQQARVKSVGGHLLAYSEGWQNGGTLMIADEYDTVDRSNLPPHMVADPRPATRSTLYQFAADGKIHAIQTLTNDGFWIKR